jgi:tetratricopeptide (TPR) repeat protein
VNRPFSRALAGGALIITAAGAGWLAVHYRRTPAGPDRPAAAISIDYPAEGSIFPPEFPPPTFIWRDAGRGTAWDIDVTFTGGAPGIRVKSGGEPMQIGEIDPRCVSPTNELPKLTTEQAAAHTWTPDAETWAAIKQHSTGQPAIVTISSHRDSNLSQAVASTEVTIQTSTDPVGAPIFYRDVPLMPSETEKGVIKPLAAQAVPLIAWRLRNVGEDRSRLLMADLPTCANCHSFSSDGKTLGMDVDGPQNDKGLYAIVPIHAKTSIRDDNVVAWSTFRGKLGGKLRVGFMSQISPDGRYVVTMINDPGKGQSDYQRRKLAEDLVRSFYVANFKDYRFLQVFYPTRGILAWYSRDSGRLQPLPGADDTRYVQANATWSPDGEYLVFVRAAARDAYSPGVQPAEYANDPNETQIQYDLYRIPFNGGKGGRAELIAGASQNGMSNSFPKISPDGRWIVYVQSRNGLLMRPDGQLYIVPATGGQARRMRCNTPLMNSWHSFSPNGRWLVFSSKSRSPYTQLFLTHIDENGNDSPAILIENTTAANRAANIPEFVNIPPEGLLKMEAPVTDYYRVVDEAVDLLKSKRYQEAIPELKKALALNPAEALPHNNLGIALAETGKIGDAILQYRRALEIQPDYPEARTNLGEALARTGKFEDAIAQFKSALEMAPDHAEAYSNLGAVLAQQGKTDEAIPYLQKAVSNKPDSVDARKNLGLAMATEGRLEESVSQLEQAVGLSGGRDPAILDMLGRVYAEMSRFPEAVQAERRALAAAAAQNNNDEMIEALKVRIASYEARASSRKR